MTRPALGTAGPPLGAAIPLPRALPGVIGMGPYLKASVCAIAGDRALVSDTAGDLGTLEAIDTYDRLLGWALAEQPRPRCAGHDLHPDFHSTRAAQALDCPTLPVQHHHAHTLATAWEYDHEGPVLGLSLDGYGMGPDGAAWGGELLAVQGLDWRRIGRLAELRQPGGDSAAREPWRMAAAALHALGRSDEIAGRFARQPHAAMLSRMLDRGINSPETSSCGRLFDAACGLAGLREVAEFEGQAPMEFEALATAPEVMPDGWRLSDGRLDCLPLLGRLAGEPPQRAANLFHGTLIAAMTGWVLWGRDATGLDTVAFGGGCFLNRVLTDGLTAALESHGMTVLMPRLLSPGDAGLSFGQAVAAALAVEQGRI